MPEFEMPIDGQDLEQVARWNALDDFTRGYIHAMFFTSQGDRDDPIKDGAKFGDLAPEALDTIKAECAKFQTDNRADLDEALDTGRINGYDDEAAGRDFWYSRNGHGVGYFDRNLGDIGDKLQDICRAMSTRDVYTGDDGKIYF